MADRKAMKAACPKPCAQCPWRIENQGTPHPHGFYAKANLRRLWAGLKSGERMTCHPTDPEMAEFEGYEGTAERHVTHECAGALVVIQREMMRVQASMDEASAEGKRDGIARYRRQHPKGLTRDGVFAHFSASVMVMPGELPMARPNLGDPAIGYEPLAAWDPGEPAARKAAR